MADNTLIDQFIRICGEKYVPHQHRGQSPAFNRLARPLHRRCTGCGESRNRQQEVAALVRLCDDHRIPIVPQGGNTSLCGGATPDDSGKAIVISIARMDQIRHFDRPSQSITVDAGCILEKFKTRPPKKG